MFRAACKFCYTLFYNFVINSFLFIKEESHFSSLIEGEDHFCYLVMVISRLDRTSHKISSCTRRPMFVWIINARDYTTHAFMSNCNNVHIKTNLNDGRHKKQLQHSKSSVKTSNGKNMKKQTQQKNKYLGIESIKNNLIFTKTVIGPERETELIMGNKPTIDGPLKLSLSR